MNESPALTRAREQLGKDKESIASGPSPETPEKPEQNAPDSQPLPPVDDLQKQVADKEAKIEELTKKLNAADGRRGSELESLRNQVAHLTDQMAAATAEKEALRSQQEEAEQANAPLPADVFAGIDKELLEDYDESALRVMATVAANITKQQLRNSATSEEVKELKRSTDYKNFLSSVETLAPGFISWNGDVEAGIEPKQEWVDFLSLPVNSDLSSETWGQMANRENSAAFAAKAFKVFQKSQGQDTSEGIEKPTLEGQIAPSKSTASPSSSGKAKGSLSRSDYEKLQKRAATPGGLTQEIRDELNKYRRAEIEGKLV